MTQTRVQHRRGSKLPAGAKLVARPTRWGNPYQIGDQAPPRYVVEQYRLLATLNAMTDPHWLDGLRDATALACYCPLHQTCHADVLLDLIERGY